MEGSAGKGTAPTAYREFEFINLGRFLAASWVLAFHANIHVGELDALALLNPLVNQGVLAMTLFFVLSGFILAYRYHAIGEGGAREFYVARVARLYPVYIAMALVTAPHLVSGHADYALAQDPLGRAIWLAGMVALLVLALQAWVPAVFNVWNFGGSWSLSVEAFFYALFPILQPMLKRQDARRLLIVIAGCVAAMAFSATALLLQLGERSNALAFYVLPIFRLPEFVLGIAVFVLCVERGLFVRPLGRLALAMAAVGLVAAYAKNLSGYVEYSFLFGLPFAMAFVAMTRWRAPAPIAAVLNYLGKVSYCLYIVQFGTVAFMERLLPFEGEAARWAGFVALTSLAAVVLYHAVEKPCHGPCRRLLQAAMRPRPGATRVAARDAVLAGVRDGAPSGVASGARRGVMAT